MKIITNGVTVRSGGVKHPPGSTIDIDDDAAARLIARGCATEVPAERIAVSVNVLPSNDLTLSKETLDQIVAKITPAATRAAIDDLRATRSGDGSEPPAATKRKRGKA